MEIEQILTLIQAVSDSELTDFEYTDSERGTSLKLKKKKDTMVVAQMPEMQAAQTVITAQPQSVAVAEKTDSSGDGQVVASPLVGTFYSAASPDQEPFVKVGDTVSKGQVLGIVEAMKLMNEIESEYDGVVKEILVQNEQLVEYGQPMFVIA